MHGTWRKNCIYTKNCGFKREGCTHIHTLTQCGVDYNKIKKKGGAFRIVGWVYVHVNFLQLFLG